MVITADLYDLIVKVVDERTETFRFLRQDFSDLRAVVYDLAQAQKRTEIKIEELAEAQKETQKEIGRLDKSIRELAEAQKRTEIKVEELAEAQKRTEIKVEELAEAQKRTEIKVEELAEAQKETQREIGKLDKSIRELAEAQKMTNKAVGSLADNIGFGVEDMARVVVSGYLQRHNGIDIKGELDRRFFYVDGRELEINLYGEGVNKEGEKVKIFGECKSRIRKKEAEKFAKDLKRLNLPKKEKIVKVMCGFLMLLLLHFILICGYNRLSRIRASSVVNCQSTDF